VTARPGHGASSADREHGVAFTGGQTDLADFRVPAGRSTDYVAVRFGTTGLPPGRYIVPLTISYTAAIPVVTVGAVTLVVS
jgi:hypothetical protein